MLKKRIIPILLFRDYSLVKGINFKSDRIVGGVIENIILFDKREVDEIIFLDIDSTLKESKINYSQVNEISKNCFVPLTIGGGVRNLNQINKLLKSGADKIAINSALFNDPIFVKNAIREFGSQCIVASIDYKKLENKNIVHINSGKFNTNQELLDFCCKVEGYGVGEILLTSIDKDGMMNGYDIPVIKDIKKKINIPLIASGGAGSCEDFFLAISECQADAVAASSLFYFKNITPKDVKIFLNSKGVNVRN